MINPFPINFASHLRFVDTTTSTNLLLKEMVESNKKNGVILPDFFGVVADYQTAGRGQGKKMWQSNKGENLLVSFYFQPQIAPSQQIYFNYFFALTVRKVISKYANEVKIKKPNDIWVGDKKIAGILIEHFIQGDKLNYTIAGVGININQTQFDASLPNPTSLKIITNKNLSREAIMKEIIHTGKEYYQKMQNGAFAELEGEYLSYIRYNPEIF